MCFSIQCTSSTSPHSCFSKMRGLNNLMEATPKKLYLGSIFFRYRPITIKGNPVNFWIVYSASTHSCNRSKNQKETHDCWVRWMVQNPSFSAVKPIVQGLILLKIFSSFDFLLSIWENTRCKKCRRQGGIEMSPRSLCLVTGLKSMIASQMIRPKAKRPGQHLNTKHLFRMSVGTQYNFSNLHLLMYFWEWLFYPLWYRPWYYCISMLAIRVPFRTSWVRISNMLLSGRHLYDVRNRFIHDSMPFLSIFLFFLFDFLLFSPLTLNLRSKNGLQVHGVSMLCELVSGIRACPDVW